mgnify:CR=1 FL=1
MLPIPAGYIPDSLYKQRKVAVDAGYHYLLEKQEAWSKRMKPELDEHRERLKRLRSLQKEQLQITFENDKRRKQIKDKDLNNKAKLIDRRFDDHERFMHDVMSIEPAPYLKLVAVIFREI